MAEEDEKIKDLARRFKWAEGQQRKDQYRSNEEKKDWLTTHCTRCGYKIQYIPTEEWRGRLRCPDCSEMFDVPSENETGPTGPTLDDFSKEREK